MKRNYLVILSLILGVNLLTGSSFAQKKSLKVLTYNIHHANPPSKPDFIDVDAIAQVIKDSGADLVALQEVDVNNRRSGESLDQAAELGRLTGMAHHFVKGIDYEGGAYGIAVLSKFPIKATDSLRLPMKAGIQGEPRVLAVITVEPEPGKPLLFACTHLDLKPETRLLQAEAICGYFEDRKMPVVLCGDFNAIPGSDEMNYFDRFFTRSEIAGSAAFTIPIDQPRREIDFVMYRPADVFEVLQHRVIQEKYASDHLPVAVELKY